MLWVKGGAAITANTTTSPDGTANGDLVTFTASGAGLSRAIQISGFSNISGTTYTKSIFVKSGTQRYFQIVFGSPFSSKFANFDTQDKVAATVSAGVTTSVTDCGNGWFRYSASVAATVTSSADEFWIYAVDSGAATWASTSSTGGTMWLFGAQYETGAFATSFIASDSGTAVTRSADVCQITGSDFSGFYNQTEGSLAVEYEQIKPLNIGMIVNFNDGGASNAMWDYASEGSSGGIDYGPSFYIRNSGTFTVQNNNSPIVSGQQKYAVAFKTNDFAMSYIGGTVQTDTTVTLPTVNQMGIGKALFFQYPFSGHIARLRYYPTRLPNATLQVLST